MKIARPLLGNCLERVSKTTTPVPEAHYPEPVTAK